LQEKEFFKKKERGPRGGEPRKTTKKGEILQCEGEKWKNWAEMRQTRNQQETRGKNKGKKEGKT